MAGEGSGGGLHTSCLSGSCTSVHGVCGGDDTTIEGETVVILTETERQALQAVLARADGQGLVSIMSTLAGRAVYNADRAAIQLLGCGGQVIAHLPLSRTHANVLEMAQI